MAQESVGSPLLWMGFLVFVLAMLALDLGVFHRKSHVVGLKEAAIWSGVWVALAAMFNLGIYLWFGADTALEFAGGYLIEKALAVDNIFVFVAIFGALSIPIVYQHRILFWGVLGALVMRAILILAGGALLHHFHWAFYLFGAILALTGIKLLLSRQHEASPDRHPIVRALQRWLPVTSDLADGKLTVMRQGRRLATPLLVALVAVEVMDAVFAVDSIPAIFAVTLDPFIVFTSNVFAILGLRSLYFLLAGVVQKLVHLKTGIAVILVFVAAKMLLIDVYKIPITISLVVIAAILGVSVLASLLKTKPPSPSARRQPVHG
jgi:tellurite resistance protein TerC